MLLELRSQINRMSCLAGLMVVACALQGCDTDLSGMTSASPDTAWSPEGTAAANGDFGVASGGGVDVPDGIQTDRALGLPELIDIAQRSHPATRVAWEQARQAAAASRMVEGTFLPIITANVIGGRQQIVTPVPDPLNGGTLDLDTTVSGIAPNVALQWLVFDFGEREAWRDAAEQTLYGANVAFNGTHQALIYDVTRSYFQYGAALANLEIAKQARTNSTRIRDAADARFRNGIATSIEVAQSKQLVALSNLRVVHAEDGLRDAYQDLLGAVGISPKSRIRVRTASDRLLPRARALPTDDLIEAAMARRPDVLASYAAVKATEANERAAQAAFRPKVYASAIAGPNNVGFQTGNLPGVNSQSTSAGVLLGVSIPVYDGDIRTNRQRQAESAVREARAAHESVTNIAMREIVIASNGLRSALEAHTAAEALVEAAQVTYDAAFGAYRNGIGTITDVLAAENGLLDAREARSDAHAASLIAASTLAFALGDMTSRTAASSALGR